MHAQGLQSHLLHFSDVSTNWLNEKITKHTYQENLYWGVMDQVGVKKIKVAKNYTFLSIIFYPSISFPVPWLSVGTIWYTPYLSIVDSRKISLLHLYRLNLYHCGFLLFMFCFYSTWKKVICPFMKGKQLLNFLANEHWELF